jgi:hypothetical protein
VSAPAAIAPLILQSGANAVEIHTQVGREADFARLWSSIAPWVGELKLIAISCPDGDNLIDYLRTLYQIISPLPCPLIWQTDGRPMSGDIGTGATRAAVKLGQKVLAAGLPGYVQLAGGTNAHTVSKLRASGMMKEHGKNLSIPDAQYIAGIAYGSYARVLLSPILEQLETMQIDRVLAKTAAVAPPSAGAQTPGLTQLEAFPELLEQAVSLARSLVSQLKEY